jgi:hypothetical protein
MGTFTPKEQTTKSVLNLKLQPVLAVPQKLKMLAFLLIVPADLEVTHL